MNLAKRLEKIWLQGTVIGLYFVAMLATTIAFSATAYYLENLYWSRALFSVLGLALMISVTCFLDKACTALNLNYYIDGLSPKNTEALLSEKGGGRVV